ncbi:MAG: aminotransferase class V-fold PLP-dependent enzyme [Abitibacteriaceae bacterium]|nr:aminotransferase class V-fold PLP-dependent enzyme [Abditibacteriaceae bacterium]
MYRMGEEEVQAVRKVIESGQLFRYWSEESEAAQFEREWAAKIGTRDAILMTSGTAALICGLVGLGVGPGDEVIIPSYTFIATALAPLAAGAIPIIADIDESLTIDPRDLEAKITPRTRAIIPVHMNGLPCAMDEVMAIAHAHKLSVLEDACQADGGSYGGKRLGSIGDAGAFSFNYFKIISCGEGGALVTNDAQVHERALIQHDGGCGFFRDLSELQTPLFAGWNFRGNEILASILRVQVQRLDDILGALRAEKRLLREELADETAFAFNPVNDHEGDCATALGLLFESESGARAFLHAVNSEGTVANTPRDSGRHIFANWEAILEQRGAHHPDLNPYRAVAESFSYPADMCPNTLTILGRTVAIPTSIKRSREETLSLAARVKQAAANCVAVA